MEFLMLAMILPTCNDDVLFPTNAAWTVRETFGWGSEEHHWRAEEFGNENESMRKELEEKTPAGARFTVIRRDGEIHWVVATTSDEVRIYEEPFAVLRYVLQKDLKAGRSWKAPRERLSCGIFEEEAEFSVSREEITVPAGKLDAFRVDIVGKWKNQDSVWVVPGKGIVKIVEAGDISELVKFEEGK